MLAPTVLPTHTDGRRAGKLPTIRHRRFNLIWHGYELNEFRCQGLDFSVRRLLCVPKD